MRSIYNMYRRKSGSHMKNKVIIFEGLLLGGLQ